MINWRELHEQLANGYRAVASEYRQSAKAVTQSDPDMAGFFHVRAVINESFAHEEDLKAELATT